ncbi:MAG TPA: hypothetical protein VGL95_02865, partial [Acetobacteraceae bacterium]
RGGGTSFFLFFSAFSQLDFPEFATPGQSPGRSHLTQRRVPAAAAAGASLARPVRPLEFLFSQRRRKNVPAHKAFVPDPGSALRRGHRNPAS